MNKPRPPSLPLPTGPMDGVDESTWMDVIQKMDEVYTRLIDDEVELEKKNAELEQSQQFIFSVLTSIFEKAEEEAGRAEAVGGVAMCGEVVSWKNHLQAVRAGTE